LKESVLAKRYAKALFELARDRNILDTIQEEVASFKRTLETNSDFRLFLHSQDLSQNEKKRRIEQLLQDKVSNVFFNFVLVLLKKNREMLFTTIAVEFQRLVDKLHKKLPATAVTALPLDSTTEAKLKDLLDKTFDADVQITSEIQPEILGGLIVNVEGHVFDGSLQNQLQRLRKELIERTNSRS